MVRADAYAQSLNSKDYGQFWTDIRKGNSKKVTKYAHEVDGCTGDTAIARRWRFHFEQLYNRTVDVETKDQVTSRLTDYSLADSVFAISVNDVCDALRKQMCGKACGPDDISMEAII